MRTFPRLLIATFFYATVCSVQAAPTQFSGVVPGTTVTKEVQSMRERQYEHLVEQETDFSCGAAALATILKYAYGWDEVTEEDVLAGLMEVADTEQARTMGFSLLDLNHYVQKLGLRGRGYEIDAASLEEVSIPVIVLLDLDGYEHFVVMKKASGDRVYIGDPALGNQVMDRDEFEQAWNNVIFAVVGDGFDNATVLLDPAQPLTARRMTDVFAPVPEQQLLDFGFKHSEVF
ncbi:C39 family peptidase [Billgrantia sp. LNSP4103-1]|uniref:C39 family peptidase n=1 Tax=Billgrantia sp. LNSP4103-1 TaxID=3410266 RepID=UPI00403F8A7E